MSRSLLLVAALLAPAACKRVGSTPPPRESEVVVLAAEPLRDAFTTMLGDFNWSHAGAAVTFAFADARALATKLEAGAPVDVVALCDQKEMEGLRAAGRVSAPAFFARDEAVVIVAGARAPKVRALADLSVAARASVQARLAARARDADAIVAKLEAGEVEAAVVSRTALRAARDRVAVVALPGALGDVQACSIAMAAKPLHPELGRAWVTFVQSATGQQTLRDAGFLGAAP